LHKVCVGPRLCEKAKSLDRDRTSYSFKAAFGAHTQAHSTFETEPENIILVELRLFEFSHGLGQNRTTIYAQAASVETAHKSLGAPACVSQHFDKNLKTVEVNADGSRTGPSWWTF
jgi:hypothetical protein